MKKMIVMFLLLAMVLSLCACGGKKTEEPGGYTVTVLDETGAPVAGAMVQLCKDACYPAVTDAEGVARFDIPEDTYKVSFPILPDGFAYVDEVQEFCFENGSKDLTITLKAIS